MSSFLFTLTAILLTVFSLSAKTVYADMDLSQQDTFQECSWSTDIVAVPNFKKDLQTTSFIFATPTALVRLVSERSFDSFAFYLPIYSLYREKQYFLLV